MSAIKQDLRYALRTFLKSPGSTAVAIVVLSLGIGANAAIFSVTSAILFRTLPYKDADHLVFVWENNLSKGTRQWRLSPADYREFRSGNQALDRMGAFLSQSSVLTGKETPERIETAAVSPSAFEILGMEPALGRAFAADEDQPDRNRVAILSAGLWQRRFGRDPNILGKQLSLDSGSFTIIGVAPPQFRLPGSQSELWIPYTPDPKDFLPTNRGIRVLNVVARLKPGISRERAQSELRSVADRIAREYPDSNAGFSVDLAPLREQLIGDVRPTLWMLMAAVVAVLLIACVNVAHLLLARASVREKEIAVRTALGASAGRLMRQLLTESVLLAVIAGAVGLLLAYWGTWILAKLAPAGLPVAGDIPLDWRVLSFTLGVSIITGLAFGLAPALASARANLNLVLRSGGRGGTGPRARTRLRDVLMVCEVASSAALLIGAGLLIRSLVRLQQVNPGFRTDHVLSMQLSLPPARYPGLKVGLFYEQLLGRVAQLPGVEAAGVCRFLPLSGSDASANFQIEGQPRLGAADQPRAKFRAASGDYFVALRIPLLGGRLFDSRDNQHTPKVVIINQTAARRYWPNDNPIGKRILSELRRRAVVDYYRRGGRREAYRAGRRDQSGKLLPLSADSTGGDEFRRGHHGARDSHQRRSGHDDIRSARAAADTGSQPAGLRRTYYAGSIVRLGCAAALSDHPDQWLCRLGTGAGRARSVWCGGVLGVAADRRAGYSGGAGSGARQHFETCGFPRSRPRGDWFGDRRGGHLGGQPDDLALPVRGKRSRSDHAGKHLHNHFAGSSDGQPGSGFPGRQGRSRHCITR